MYQILCNNCNNGDIGLTTQRLGKKLNGSKFNENEVTVLRENTEETSHKFNYHDIKYFKKAINHNYNNFKINETLQTHQG